MGNKIIYPMCKDGLNTIGAFNANVKIYGGIRQSMRRTLNGRDNTRIWTWYRVYSPQQGL